MVIRPHGVNSVQTKYRPIWVYETSENKLVQIVVISRCLNSVSISSNELVPPKQFLPHYQSACKAIYRG